MTDHYLKYKNLKFNGEYNKVADFFKCPNCGAPCWRDEHPDGIAAGNWQCSNCEWFEPNLQLRDEHEQTKTGV